MMRRQLGDAEAEGLFAALEAQPPTSIRLNRAKAGEAALPAGCAGRVPWCADGYYLSERPQFTLDPLLHAGCYYVQEAASMAVALTAQAVCSAGGEEPLRVLDLCAAPGGKSTLWASLLAERQGGGLLVCNEPVRTRAQILAENVAKWGLPDVLVANAYPADFAPLGAFFDVIAADVPCSGEGMFRKDRAARAEWSPANVAMCAARQFDIVRDVWPALRQGGFLVYSTCTFNDMENEGNVRRICEELGAEAVSLGATGSGSVGTEWGTHFYPHRTAGEGFFIALLRKTSGTSAHAAPGREKARRGKSGALPREADALRTWLRRPEAYTLFSPDGGNIYAMRTALDGDRRAVAACLGGRGSGRLLAPGLHLALLKGGKCVPQQPLALSTELAPGAFPRAALTHGQATSYLRREAAALPADTPRGHVLMCYDGHPLGFANNLGARANNLYPAEWRIRKQL